MLTGKVISEMTVDDLAVLSLLGNSESCGRGSRGEDLGAAIQRRLSLLYPQFHSRTLFSLQALDFLLLAQRLCSLTAVMFLKHVYLHLLMETPTQALGNNRTEKLADSTTES